MNKINNKIDFRLEEIIKSIYYAEDKQNDPQFFLDNISQIKQSILKAIMERLNKLMDDRQIAELEKRFKLFSRGWNKKCCPMCGVQPSYQKKLILLVIKDVLETNQNK